MCKNMKNMQIFDSLKKSVVNNIADKLICANLRNRVISRYFCLKLIYLSRLYKFSIIVVLLTKHIKHKGR